MAIQSITLKTAQNVAKDIRAAYGDLIWIGDKATGIAARLITLKKFLDANNHKHTVEHDDK